MTPASQGIICSLGFSVTALITHSSADKLAFVGLLVRHAVVLGRQSRRVADYYKLKMGSDMRLTLVTDHLRFNRSGRSVFFSSLYTVHVRQYPKVTRNTPKHFSVFLSA